jgi:hypothetical protein
MACFFFLGKKHLAINLLTIIMERIKYLCICFFTIFIGNDLICQHFYHFEKIVAYSCLWNVGLKVNKDSSANLILNYSDNSIFNRYDGKLKRVDDTTLEFTYKPVIVFGQNMRSYLDSSIFRINTKDTALNYFVTYMILKKKRIELKLPTNRGISIRDCRDFEYILLTDFYNPITGNQLIVYVDCNSEPEWTIYGSKTKKSKLKIMSKDNSLIIKKGQELFMNEDIILNKEH